jgi:hypothetical protein
MPRACNADGDGIGCQYENSATTNRRDSRIGQSKTFKCEFPHYGAAIVVSLLESLDQQLKQLAYLS